MTEVFRAPAHDTELGAYAIEADAQIAAPILLVQYDPDLYAPDPEGFRPERFLDGAPEAYAWVPFAFAQLEMQVVLSTILARVQLQASRPAAEKARFRGVTLLPHRGGEATVVRAESAAVDQPLAYSSADRDWNSKPTKRSSPMTQASWPGSMT